MGTCQQCRFAVIDDSSGQPLVWCHRAPPMVKTAPDGGSYTQFLQVGATMWCGEFKRAWMRLFRGHETP